MRALRLVVPLVVAFSLVGCGGEKDVAMPDVTSKKLDVAYEQIKDAGFDDEDKIKIEGGGILGVVVESNWTVCKQSPAAGKTVSSAPKLIVKRSCKKRSDTDTDDKPSPSPTPTRTPTKDPTPSPTKPATPKLPEVLTAKNSAEFAALLKLGDECSDKVDRFAKKYATKKIQFDGSISAFAGHEGTKTRFDMLVGPGDKGANTSTGPQFQYYDKTGVDMNLTGNYPDNLAVGQKYTFIAEVGEYDPDSCLFQLVPVETKVR